MTREEAIAKIKNFADHCQPNEEFLMAIEALSTSEESAREWCKQNGYVMMREFDYEQEVTKAYFEGQNASTSEIPNKCEDCISRADAIKAMEDIEKKDANWYPKDFDAKRAIEALRGLPSVTPKQEPRWIPVSEGLPEECCAVLVWCSERKNIYCACYENKQWWIFGAYFQKVEFEVVAWMPLPESYKPQESEET